ncbi:hypothetical protein L4C39_04725 [Vibrio clamense]|uniref:hypothetical protein n=1 Tax=Vibrio clamense TaxID=2910254 RepID=UPI003D1F9A32
MSAQSQSVVLSIEKNQLLCMPITDDIAINSVPVIKVDQSDVISSLESINATLKNAPSSIHDLCGTLTNDVTVNKLPVIDIAQPISSEVAINSVPTLSLDNTLLITTLEKVNTTLGSIPDGSYGVTFAGALFSVLAAFTFNILYWWVVSLKKGLSTEITKFEFVLDRFEESATKYWIQPYSASNSQDLQIKEMRIKADHRLLRDAQGRIEKKFFLGRFNPSKAKFSSNLKSLLENLFDCATGGDFESYPRLEDTKRCNRIIKLCTQIRVEVTGLDT